MNKSSNLFLGGIFVAGMATTYLLQKTKVLGAENRVFNACSFSDPQGLTPDGYETDIPNATTSANSSYYVIARQNPNSATGNYGLWKTTRPNGSVNWTYNEYMAKRIGSPWKDMTKAVQTSCPHCCTSGSSSTSSPPAGSSGSGSSTSSTTSCPACDSCCPTVTCPECMDCPPAVKCDSCCEPCGNQGEQSTFLGRLFGR